METRFGGGEGALRKLNNAKIRGLKLKYSYYRGGG